MLGTFSIPPENVAEVMFESSEESALVGQTTRFTLDQGTLITASMVGSGPVEISGPAWAVQIPSGMVAATIPANRLSLVGYGVDDGAHVNVNACMLFVDVDPAFQSALPNFTSVLTGTGFLPEYVARSFGFCRSAVSKPPGREEWNLTQRFNNRFTLYLLKLKDLAWSAR